MNNEALQFLFSLFSFVGVVGILFYLILQKTKADKLQTKVEALEEDLVLLKEEFYHPLEATVEKKPVENDSSKEKIIELYEQGANINAIANSLNIPKATIEMVIKFHEMNKSDNWRDSV